MSELYIDPIVFDAVEGKPLPKGHHAKMFAAGLPDAHPVKRLLTGEAQWLGDNKNVLGFLQLFCEIYEEHLRRADENGILRTMAPLDQAAMLREIAEFERLFPDDVLFRGRNSRVRRYSLRTLLQNARDGIALVTQEFPPLRTVGLDAFNRTLAKLVRAIRMS
ncbi:MAG: hypothetical protein AAB554_01920 [Patescibacteria group bacterium]